MYVHCRPETLLNRSTQFHHRSNLFGGLLTRLDRLASTRCVWLIANGDSGCGIAPGCAAARSSSIIIDTIIRGWLFPSFLCITQVLTISYVRGSLCCQDVVRSRRACFVCDLGQIPRFPNRIQNSHCLLWG